MKTTIKAIILLGLITQFLFKPAYTEDIEYNSNIGGILHEIKCLELNLYHEARGEIRAGIIAIGNVTINRTKDRRFPNTICGVINQPNQFSWVKTKSKSALNIPPDIKEIAYKLIVTKTIIDNTYGSLYFHSSTIDDPWGRKHKVTIGNHIFYR